MEFDLLKEIIAEVLNVDAAEITTETTFVDDLGADSLDVFQIIMGVEEKLNIEVDTEAADLIPTLIFDEIDAGISGRTAQAVSEKLSTVGDAVELIKKTVANK